MPIVELNSLTEEKPGLLYHMTDAQLRSRQKKEEAAFIAEGPKVVLAAINAGCRPLSLPEAHFPRELRRLRLSSKPYSRSRPR